MELNKERFKNIASTVGDDMLDIEPEFLAFLTRALLETTDILLSVYGLIQLGYSHARLEDDNTNVRNVH